MKRCSLFSVLSLFVFVVMVLLFNLSTCCAMSYEDIKEYVNQTADYYANNSYYQTIKSKINGANSSVIDKINTAGSGYVNVSIWYEKNGSYIYTFVKFWNATSKLEGTSSSLIYTGNYKRVYFYNNSNGTVQGPNNETNSSIDGGYSYDGTAGKENSLMGMTLLGQTPAGQLPNTFVGDQAIPKYEKLEFINSLENTAYNGNLLTYYYQGDFYTNNQIKLGEIVSNDTYYYELRLKDSNGVIKGTSYVALNTSPYTFYNDGAIYVDNNQVVYAVPRLLNYSTQYQLEITSYYGDGGDNLYEDIDWFIFLPFNAVISGDFILYLGSGDYTIQNSVNDTIDFYTDYSEVNSELDNFFSGDTNEIVSNLNFPNLSNNYFVVIYNVVSGISDTLRMSGDPYFDVSLHGETPKRIYASDFTTPPSVLKTFISMSLVFGTLYILYMQLSGFIMLLNTGQIKDAINQIDDVTGATLYKM